MKEMPLTGTDKMVLLDDYDFEIFSKWKWALSGYGYVMRSEYLPTHLRNGRVDHTTVYLHKSIAGVPGIRRVDHKNLNRLDCRRRNLRPATDSQNIAHRRKQTTKKTLSKYKGVTLHIDHPRKCPWVAQITVNYIRTRIGSYRTEIEAAKAYNIAAVRYFGEFSLLNTI